MRSFDEDDDPDRPGRSRRVYVHARCGGETIVSDRSFIHLCDPFWPCTSTYCCGCDRYVPLDKVRWADTHERISDFRRRLRRRTPGLLKAWRYGLGLVPGAAVGLLAAFAPAFLVRAPLGMFWFLMFTFAVVGAAVGYVLGTMLLSSAFGVNYRRMR